MQSGLLLFLGAFASTSLAAALEERACGGIATHVVTSGDKLSAIASSSGVGVCNIARSNALTDINSINVGHTLTFSASGCETVATGSSCCIPAATATTHVAVSGDRYWDLHVKYGIDVTALATANTACVSTNIPIGTTLTIPARPSVNC